MGLTSWIAYYASSEVYFAELAEQLPAIRSASSIASKVGSDIIVGRTSRSKLVVEILDQLIVRDSMLLEICLLSAQDPDRFGCPAEQFMCVSELVFCHDFKVAGALWRAEDGCIDMAAYWCCKTLLNNAVFFRTR